MRTILIGLVLGLVAVGCRFPESRAASALEGMTVPVYTDAGEVVRPERYRQWTFVGASLGLRYAADGVSQDDGPGSFHNVYIQPEAYAYFMEQGVFPEKTILAMETYEPGTREPKSNLTGGYFEDELTGFSIAVKDSERFEETWGYASFDDSDAAMPFPKARCHDCHAEHGATDNVFTQFYPILRR